MSESKGSGKHTFFQYISGIFIQMLGHFVKAYDISPLYAFLFKLPHCCRFNTLYIRSLYLCSSSDKI